ncbi:MAG TPA: cytochrome c3 family protein [Acidimicrobiia bacterium]|jgi:predicted CXXCH cytochrome family protein
MRDPSQQQTSLGSGRTLLRRTHLLEFALATGFVIVGLFVIFSARPAAAQELEPEGEGPRWDSESCLSCHDGSADVLVFPSGEELSVAVDGASYRLTEHASLGVECVHCHTNIVKTPHDPITIPDSAGFSASLGTSCSQCHWRQERIRLDQTHALLDPAMRDEAPGCVQCHDPHAAEAFALSSPEMQGICAECHAGPVWADVEAIHVLDPTVVQESSPPPLILFYGLIVAAIAVIVLVSWGGVAAFQWMRRRQVRPA